MEPKLGKPRELRRPVLAVVGNAGKIPDELEARAQMLGELAVDYGFRIVCGGRDGVMGAVARGAHHAKGRRDGDVIGILPSYDRADANPWIDIVIPTGLGFARNLLVASTGDVVIAMGGGSGTLSEIALAWQLGRPVLAWTGAYGWASKLAGERLDERYNRDVEGFDEIAPMIHRAWELADVALKTEADQERAKAAGVGR